MELFSYKYSIGKKVGTKKGGLTGILAGQPDEARSKKKEIASTWAETSQANNGGKRNHESGGGRQAIRAQNGRTVFFEQTTTHQEGFCTQCHPKGVRGILYAGNDQCETLSEK